MAERSIPSEEKQTSEEAERGTRIHKLIEDYGNLFPNRLILPLPQMDDFPDMPEDDFWILSKSINYRNEVVVATFGVSSDIDDEGDVWRETRHFLKDDFGSEICSGKIDEIVYFEGTLLIIDYKTGRGSVERSESNEQLIVDHVCLADDLPDDLWGETIYRYAMAIVQPLADDDKKWTYAEIGVSDIIDQTERIRKLAKEAMMPDMPRNPGYKQCLYCRFRSRCPEANAGAFSIVHYSKGFDLNTPVTPDELDKIDFAKYLLDEYKTARHKKAMDQLRDDPESIQGWRIAPGRRTVAIEDPRAAFAMLSDVLDGESFATACTVSIPRLVKPYQERAGLTKVCAKTGREMKLSQAEIRRILEEKLDPLITTRFGAEILKRK